MSDGDFLAQARALVAAQFDGARLVSLERLTGGVSAQVFRLDLEMADGAARRCVLRVHGASHGGHDAALEFALLRAVVEAGAPAARPLCVDESRRILPDPYLVLEYVEGTTALAPAMAQAQIAAMAATLAAIHATPLRRFPPLPERLDPMPELLDFLPAGFDDLRARLSARKETAYTGPAVLLHGDFWPGNILWQGARIAAVLDWEDAAIGDPLSDVACAALELRYVLGAEAAPRFVADYATKRPVDPARLALWQIYVAAAAQHFMGNWRLDPDREAHMRREALASLREAGIDLLGSDN